MSINQEDYQVVHNYIVDLLPGLKHPADELMPFPWISPGVESYSEGVWWDAFFVSIRLAEGDGQYEHFRNWVDLTFRFQDSHTGNVPPTFYRIENARMLRARMDGNCFPIHCFQVQAALFYALSTGDKAWAKKIYPQLKMYIEKRKFYDGLPGFAGRGRALPYGLYPSSGGGGDNEAGSKFLPNYTTINIDVNCYIYMELKALSVLAEFLDHSEDVKTSQAEANRLKDAINTWMWDDEDGFYYSILVYNAAFLKFKGIVNLMPLFAGITPKDRAAKIVKHCVMSEKHFLSKYGLRSLSKECPFYNNAVLGNPQRLTDRWDFGCMTSSNWEGPVWSVANYLVIRGLINYGFKSEAGIVADRLLATIADVIRKDGTTYENYSAETGKGLYAPGFGSWNTLVDIMHKEIETDESLYSLLVEN